MRVAAPSDTSLQLLCTWTDEYTLRHPGARVMVFVGDRMHDFNRDAVDIAIRYGELKDSSMVGRLLTSCERIVVAAPAYLQRAGVPRTPADLLQHRCLAWLRRDQPKVQWSFGLPDGRTESIVVSTVCVVRRDGASVGRGRCRARTRRALTSNSIFVKGA